MSHRTLIILSSIFIFILCFWIGCVETIDAGQMPTYWGGNMLPFIGNIVPNK